MFIRQPFKSLNEIVLEALAAAGARPEQDQDIYDVLRKISDNHAHMNKLFFGLNALKAVGASIPENKKLYQYVIAWPPQSTDVLIIGFQELQKLGVSLLDEDTCRVMIRFMHGIRLANEAAKLTIGIRMLEKVGATFTNDKDLYIKMINYLFYVEDLNVGFEALIATGATLQHEKDLYDDILETRGSHELKYIGQGFKALQAAGATLTNDKALYKMIIKHKHNARDLNLGFEALQSVGATLRDDGDLYLEIINVKWCDAIKNMSINIRTLHQACAHHKTHRDLYLAVIQYSSSRGAYLAPLLKMLQEIGASSQDDYDFVRKTIRFMDYLANMDLAFQALSNAGASFKKYKGLYELVIKKTSSFACPPFNIEALSEAGVSLEEYEDLYRAAIIHQTFNSANLEPAFAALKKVGATLPADKDLYLAVIQKSYAAEEISQAFITFKKLNLTIQENKDLFLLLVNNINHKNKRDIAAFCDLMKRYAVLDSSRTRSLGLLFLQNLDDMAEAKRNIDLLEALGFSFKDDFSYYDAALGKPLLAMHVLLRLTQWRFDKKSHKYVYELFFFQNRKPMMPTFTLSMKMLAELEKYLQTNQLLDESAGPAYIAQKTAITQLLKDIIEEDDLTAGPLNKSAATQAFERLLEKIAHADTQTMTMRFDQTHGYLLAFNDEPLIYINHLLAQVNLDHLELAEELVQRIGEKTQSLTPNFYFNTENLPDIYQKLPLAAQAALKRYFDQSHYNLNRLFRGVPFSTTLVGWTECDFGSNALLANFLCGCLVNWAAKELPLVNLQVHDGAIPSRQEKFLARTETLTKNEEELGTIKRRLANPAFTPSITSVSSGKEGIILLQPKGDTDTLFENPNLVRPVRRSAENEVLIPHGTTIIYTKNPAGGFFAREVNSPGIVPTGYYWSAVALSYAYQHHLKNPYQELTDSVTINGVTVFRPNHGLANTYNVMGYLKVVIDYFAQHAKDEEFRLFCTYISDVEQEWLMAAAAFRVSGRESETSSRESLVRYEAYREASRVNFTAFLTAHPPKQSDDAMQERMEHIMRYMGNPAYEQAVGAKPAINQHADEMERQHRNFLHRILSLAHKLDLLRCYFPGQMEEEMHVCRSLSASSKEQQTAYQRMLTYAADLNTAQGNRLFTEIDIHGKFVPARRGQSYQPPFERVSHSMRDLQAISDTVTRPKLREKYQLPHANHSELQSYILAMCESPGLPPRATN